MIAISTLCALVSLAGATTTTQQVKLTATDAMPNDKFGYSVAIDRSIAAIGVIGDDESGTDSGSVYLYELVSGLWTFQSKLVPVGLDPGDWFGYSTALEGSTLVVGAKRDDDLGGNSGSVHVFEREGANWNRTAKLHASDGSAAALFGHDVALDQDRLVIGAWGDNEFGARAGAAYVFQRNASGWREEAKLTASDALPLDDFGRAVCIEGARIVVGKIGDQTNGENSGAAYVFERGLTGWKQVAKLFPSDGSDSDNFGAACSLSGDAIVIGSPGDDDFGAASGAAYVFELHEGQWLQRFKLLASDGSPGAQFGTSVGLRGERVVIGASNDNQPTPGAGAAYEFIRGEGVWLEVNKFVATDGGLADSLGWDLDFDDHTLITGAQNGDTAGDNSGAAYLFGLRELYVAFCYGDGGDQMGCANCPCGNNTAVGTKGGCLNSSLRGAEVVASGIPFVSMDSMRIGLRGGLPNNFAVLLSATDPLPQNPGHPCFGLGSGTPSASIDGLRCIGGQMLRHGARATDERGNLGGTTPAWGPPDAPRQGLIHQAGFAVGQRRAFQVFYRDALDQVCQRGLNTSNGMSVVFGP